MEEGQGLAVHGPDEERVLLESLGDRHAAGHGLMLVAAMLVGIGPEMAGEQGGLLQARLAQHVA